jgi:hypothetical protein
MKSYQFPAAVRDHSVTEGTVKHVLLTLATYANDNGECYPSHKALARATGLSRRTIERVMKEIPANELQVVEKGKAAGHSTKYRLTVNSRHADGSQTLNSRHGDGLTTNELPIELPKARKRAPSRSLASDARQVVILPELDTPQFRKSWAEWLEYRKQIKKPLSPLSQQKQLNKLKFWGSARAVAAINHSIANGWIGIFEPQGENGHKSKLRTSLDESRLPRL